MSTTTIDPTSSSYAHYVAVEVNGEKPSERAKALDIAPASVSAGVKRIKDALAAGATLPDGSVPVEGVDSPSFYQWVEDTHDAEMRMLVELFDTKTESINNERAKCQRIIETATARLAALDSQSASVATTLARALPKGKPSFADLRSAYDEATAPKDAAAEAAPSK